MWSERSPLPLVWCQLAFWFMLAGVIAAFWIGWPALISPVLALLILMYYFNAVDLKLDKGQHKRNRGRRRRN